MSHSAPSSPTLPKNTQLRAGTGREICSSLHPGVSSQGFGLSCHCFYSQEKVAKQGLISPGWWGTEGVGGGGLGWARRQ